ncbi:MAG: ATP-binding protein [Prolixibacteraceae bacterium]
MSPEVLGKTDLEIFGDILGKQGYEEDMSVIMNKKPLINKEEIITSLSGIQRWLLTSKIPLLDSNGDSIGLVGIGRDITDIKKAEEQIKKLTKSIEQSPSSIVITDVQGNIEYVNQKFTEITGYTAEEVIGKNPRILKSGKNPRELYLQMWDRISRGDVWRGEFYNLKKNGEFYWEWATITSIKNEEGLITNYIALKEDISFRKQMEADLIIARNNALESDRLKSAFLANMSHEIRTPLNSIIGFSELLGDSDFSLDDKKEFIQHIVDNGNSLLNIISDIMDVSKMESGEIRIRKSPVNVCHIIKRIRDQFMIKLKEKGLEFILSKPEIEPDILILADEDRIIQILTNLISNALKFTHKGYIQFSCKRINKMVQLSLQDTGIGIPAEYHEKIFDRFSQVESSATRKYGGNGLGLAITKNLVELMGGKIWLESEAGKGSTFYFLLPLFVNE